MKLNSILIPFLCTFIFFINSCKSIVKNKPESKNEQTYNEYIQRIAKEWQNKPAPNFSIQTMDYQQFRLQDYAGKIVLLNFWFINCPPCVTEIASLNELHHQYKNQNVVVIAISTDKNNELLAFAQKKKMDYRIAADGKTIANSYKVNTYPSTYLIDKKGVIRNVFTGANDWDATYTYSEIKPHLEKILNE